MHTIHHFTNEFTFLSNFHPSPITYQGREWPTVEHAFQAQKTLFEGERELIRSAQTPGKAKRLGRKVSFLRPDWEEVKADIMHELLLLKFTQNRELMEKLVDTGHAHLVEGNGWHDNTWGDCTCDRCSGIQGKNLLGKLLMKVREHIQAMVRHGTDLRSDR